MNYPQIPPHSDDFKQYVGEWFFLYPGGRLSLLWVSEGGQNLDLKAAWRHIIACVARCAWLDRAEEFGDFVIKARDECLTNAEAWRWGPQ